MKKTLVRTHVSTFLPVELWNDIFRRVERKDLTALARISRLFQKEAEYILYHLVDLRAVTDGTRLASWCMSIVGERRRASRVHTLWFPGCFTPSGDLADSTIQQFLAQAFKAIVNLKELHSYMYHTSGLGISVPTITPSTLENCTFRLTGMVGPFVGLTADEMWKFLRTQPDISHWTPSTRFIQSIDAIPPNTLPSIRDMVLSCPKKLPLLYGRPIRKLRLNFEGAKHIEHNGRAVIHSLGRFNETLRDLSYMVHGLLTNWTITDVIRSLAKDAPSIESLTIHFGHTVRTDEQNDLVEAVSQFKHLRSLDLFFHMAVLRDPNTDSPDPSNPLEHDPFWGPDDSPTQPRKVASMFMARCQTLQQIMFPFRNMEGKRVGLRYTWSQDGGPGKGGAEAWLEGIESTSSRI